jgi:hypothetical protein
MNLPACLSGEMADTPDWLTSRPLFCKSSSFRNPPQHSKEFHVYAHQAFSYERICFENEPPRRFEIE